MDATAGATGGGNVMDDYISRNAALSALDDAERNNFHNSVLWPDHVEECREVLRDVPASDVRPVKRGKWIQKAEQVGKDYWVLWECSECGYVRTRGWAHTQDGRKPKAYFCERCSADMREG